MKNTLIFLLFTLFAAATISAQPVKENTKLKKDSIGVYRERTIVVKEYLPDTAIINDQIHRMQVEIDTLQSRIKRLRQEVKDWKKAKDGPVTPGSAPKKEEVPAVTVPDAVKPPTAKPKKKNR